MLRLLAIVLALATIFAACSSDNDGGSSADRQDELREAIDASFAAFQDGDIEGFYNSFSSEFHDRCDEEDFRGIMALARIFLSGIDNVELVVEDVEFAGDDRATANIYIEGDEQDGFSVDGDDDGFLDIWVYEDGEWKTDVDDTEPCDVSLAGDDDGDDDETPEATGPGTSREEAVEVGEHVRAGDLEVTVTSANLDAEQEVLALDEFNEPPGPGRRYVLVNVGVRHAGGEDAETLSVSSSDFKLTGSGNVLYDGFGDASCGFFDGQIQGEMFPGGTLEGSVCFQIPDAETGLILVAQPFVSFDDGDRRFIALE